MAELITDLDAEMHDSYAALNRAIGSLIEEYSMVSFVPMDISKSDSVELVLAHVDTAIQVLYGLTHRWSEDQVKNSCVAIAIVSNSNSFSQCKTQFESSICRIFFDIFLLILQWVKTSVLNFNHLRLLLTHLSLASQWGEDQEVHIPRDVEDDAIGPDAADEDE